MLNLNDKYRIGSELDKLIRNDLVSNDKREMRQSIRYYGGKHDILNYRMFYVNNNGQTVEERGRSNYKLAHRFHTQLVDQKVAYLLSNPVEFVTNNEQLQEDLKSYITPQLQQTIYDLVEGASIKGWEGLYYNFDENGKIQFQTVDSFGLIPIYDKTGKLVQLVRHYQIQLQDEIIKRADVYDSENVYYFIETSGNYVLDKDKEVNPIPHKLLIKGGKVYKPKSSRLPFLILNNNKQRTTDLEPIKDLIDDYDLHASGLTNNLVDFDQPIFMVKNYPGDDLNDVVNNLRTKRAVGVDDDGGLEVHTVDIPFQARKEKLAITRQAIFEFAMGYDSATNDGDRALTNIGIMSRFTLLNIKTNKIETRLRKLLDEMLVLILENIRELSGRVYDVSDINVEITRSVLVNEKEKAEEENILAQAKLNRINAIITASMNLDSQIVSGLLAEELDIEPERIQAMIESQDYIEPLEIQDLQE